MTVADENNDKSKSLNMAVSQIRKQFGEGAVMRLGAIRSGGFRKDDNRPTSRGRSPKRRRYRSVH